MQKIKLSFLNTMAVIVFLLTVLNLVLLLKINGNLHNINLTLNEWEAIQ